MQRILIVDDDPSVSSVLRRGLNYEAFAVDVAASGEEALEIARERYPDLVILDVMMPGLDGLEVLKRLRAADEHLPVLMLTAKDRDSDLVAGLEGGADDYLTKPFTFKVLLARVRALLRRSKSDHPAVLRFEDLSLDTGAREARRKSRVIELTKTEFELLKVFLSNPRQVLTREVLTERVWGFDFEGGTNVLETYIKQLRQKLEAGGESRLIHTRRGSGYVLREA
jgi:DNA-binding response OmpR family regulator